MARAQASQHRTRTTSPAPGATATPAPRRELWRYVALYLAIFLGLVLVYWPALHGGILWDDPAHITRVDLRSMRGLWRIWFELGATQQYYPVVHSAFWVMSHVVGDATIGYHLLNIALHAASAVLLAAILWRLEVRGALVVAVLFAVHPVHTESVAWITELKNMLSGVFFLSALLVYLRFDATRRRGLYALALGFFFLAILSKSVTATLPVLLLVLFWFRSGRVDLRRDVRPLVPFVVLGGAMGLLTAIVEWRYIGASGASFNLSLIERCLIAGRAICFYLSKLLWPAHLMFVYPRWEPNDTVWWQYLFPLAVLVALAALWTIRGWSRAPFAAFLMFCLALGPALGFVNVFPFRYSFVADHFQYLASLPMLTFCTASIVWLLEKRLPPLQVTAALLLLVASPLAVLTRAQSREYVDAESLYRSTLAQNPRAWLAHNNLAMLLLDGNPTPADLKRALTGFNVALALAPNEHEPRYNVGTALYRLQRYEESIPYFRAAVSAQPDYADAWGNLGAALQKLERWSEAEEADRRTLQINPHLDWVRYNLSSVLFEAGRPDEAAVVIEATPTTRDSVQNRIALAETFLDQRQFARAIDQYERALKTGPLPPEALNHLGYALLQEGRPAEAEMLLRQAVGLRPESAIYSNLGNALQQLGRLEEAFTAYRAALATPDGALRAETHNDFGVALARGGRLDEAIVHFKEAVRLNPTYAAAQGNLARALRSPRGG
jgi:tetratricopeptide (TPR) repeat protein